KLFTARHPEAQVHEVVGRIGVKDDAMVPVVHPQIAAVTGAFVDDFHREDVSGEFFPRLEVFHPEAHVSEFSYLDHFIASICVAFYRGAARTQSEPSAPRRTASVSVG